MEMDEKKIEEVFERGKEKAKEYMADESKLERLLQRLERKLKLVPVVGTKLADVPIMASLLRSYFKKEYPDVPVGTILSIISALVYFVSPIDIVPDSIPALGYIDDAAVIAICWKFVQDDVDEYSRWREANGKLIDF